MNRAPSAHSHGIRLWCLVWGLLCAVCISPVLAQPDAKVLRSGWYLWDPYQYEIVKDDLRQLTGFDVRLLRMVFGRMGYELQIDPVSWKQHQLDVKEGRRDIAAGAFFSTEREQYAYYSHPYRTEKDMLYVREEDQHAFQFETAEQLIRILESGSYRLGVVDGFFYGKVMMGYINDPRHAQRVIRARDDKENFANLLAGKIDAFPIDHLVGATLSWRHGWQPRVAQMPNPVFEDTIHVLFSRQTTDQALVDQFNQTLQQIQASGEYSQVMRDYLLPVLLGQTAGQSWFFVIDLIGTIAFAISGLLLARANRYSLFGALVLAALPSIGGGLMRDILIKRETISALNSPVYVGTIVATVLAFYLAFHAEAWFKRKKTSSAGAPDVFIGRISNHGAIEFFDALGLATFTVVGVVAAVESKLQPLWMWGPILAALSGAGGGIVRDVMRADPDNPGLKGSFYAEVALIWGLILSLFLDWYSSLPKYELTLLNAAVAVVVVGGLTTRLLVVHYRIRSPMY
jgi:polar amino acid transport system substrate-binding protein